MTRDNAIMVIIIIIIITCEEEELSKATDCPLNEFVYRCEAIFVMSLSVEN